jgi:DNA-binding transcriptional ArsR family regulator
VKHRGSVDVNPETSTSTLLKSEGVMNHPQLAVSKIAAAVGEPARTRILYCLMDGHARTSTELAVVAGVSPSTASVHLNQLKTVHLVNVLPRGKYRYYFLEGPDVAQALEALAVLVGGVGKFVPSTPSHLRDARTCYDHMAGRLGVLLHNQLKARGWLLEGKNNGKAVYDLTSLGKEAFEALGIDLAATRSLRRRFAYACLDWSERQPHLGGALGAALLKAALKRRWVIQEVDGRALTITRLGHVELKRRFGVYL